ncbi:TraC family protein [Agrobacterium rosae]
MKKPSSKIREEIARLQDQLRQAETREAERIGRIALKAGLGEIKVYAAEFQAASRTSSNGFTEAKALPGSAKRAGGWTGRASTCANDPCTEGSM